MTVVEAAARYGLSVIPAIQSLGHCSWVGVHPEYARFDEGYERQHVAGVLCPAHPDLEELLAPMIRDIAPLATSGIIHVGLDEVFTLGQCTRCAPRRAQEGEGGIFLRHANRVADWVRATGNRPAIWGDMFYYHPDKMADLAHDVLVFDRHYYAFDRYPRVELFGFSEMDTQRMWQAQGIDSWGCPASFWSTSLPINLPSESLANARSWGRYLTEQGRRGMMVTQWELSPTSAALALPFDIAIGDLMWSMTAPPFPDLLTAACDVLYARPELAPLLEEMGRARFHGYADRNWVDAPSLAGMLTYQADADDLKQAGRFDAVAREIEALATGAQHSELLRAYTTAAQWLAYQYRKRGLLNVAVLQVADGQYGEVQTTLTALAEEADRLAACWQALWNAHRYADDETVMPIRLRKEAAWLREEIAAVQADRRRGRHTRGRFRHRCWRCILPIAIRPFRSSPSRRPRMARPLFSLVSGRSSGFAARQHFPNRMRDIPTFFRWRASRSHASFA